MKPTDRADDGRDAGQTLHRHQLLQTGRYDPSDAKIGTIGDVLIDRTAA
jgi:hypothetical protein